MNSITKLVGDGHSHMGFSFGFLVQSRSNLKVEVSSNYERAVLHTLDNGRPMADLRFDGVLWNRTDPAAQPRLHKVN